jgi:PAS domain S-box-containing protein
MEEIFEFLEKFFDTGAFPARWHCGRWSEFHGWLYIISDVAIWAAYFTIPLLLLRFVKKRKDLPFPRIFWLFGAFILACGLTHLIDAIIFWFPIYRVSAFVRLLTAIISWATIIALYRIVPQALQLRSPKELEREVAMRTRELHDTIGKMRFMADVMPQMVWMARPDGTLDYFNRRTLEFTGRPLKELEGWGWSYIQHPDDRAHTIDRWRFAVENKIPFEGENRILSADGDYYWHLTRAVPQLGDAGEVICWIGTATNIEQHKKNEELLERKVADRTEELRIANESLVQSNKDLENFGAIASHDLQAPLRTISLFLDILKNHNAETLDERSLKYIDKTRDAAHRMKRLIENLLLFSKINATMPEHKKVDLNIILEQILVNIDAMRSSRKFEVIIGALPTVDGDEILLSQLLQNLVVNAIRYNTSETAMIEVTGFTRDKYWLVEVKDNGVGISPQDQARVFDLFTRFSSDSKGNGLGLSICKRIVAKHHGDIWLTSVIGEGTTFHFTIARGTSL